MWYIPMKSRCLSALQNRHNFASPRWRLLLHCSAPSGDWFKRFFTSKDCELPLPRESADKMCLLIFETRVIVRCDRDWNSSLPSCAVSSPNHLLVKIETSRNPRDSYPSGSQQVLLHRFWTQQIPGGSCGTTGHNRLLPENRYLPVVPPMAVLPHQVALEQRSATPIRRGTRTRNRRRPWS